MAQDRLKERLTGAVALLLLAVIAWFWLLSAEDPAAPIVEETAIPPVPAIEPFPVPQPDLPPELADAPAPEAPPPEPVTEPPVASEPPAPVEQASPSVPEPEAPAQVPLVEQSFATDADGLPQGWVVQVASLSTSASAERLVAELKASGFKAYSGTARSGGKTVHRVYVGPKLSREAADTERRRIAAEFKVEPIVVRFEP